MKSICLTSGQYLDTNAIWKKPKNSKTNGDWMIGKMGQTKIANIRGISGTGTSCIRPDRCQMWSYSKGMNFGNKDWTKYDTSTASGINVTCIKGNKYFFRGQ